MNVNEVRRRMDRLADGQGKTICPSRIFKNLEMMLIVKAQKHGVDGLSDNYNNTTFMKLLFYFSTTYIFGIVIYF